MDPFWHPFWGPEGPEGPKTSLVLWPHMPPIWPLYIGAFGPLMHPSQHLRGWAKGVKMGSLGVHPLDLRGSPDLRTSKSMDPGMSGPPNPWIWACGVSQPLNMLCNMCMYVYIHTPYMPPIQGHTGYHKCTCTYIKCIASYGVAGCSMCSYPMASRPSRVMTWVGTHDEVMTWGWTHKWTLMGTSPPHGVGWHCIALHEVHVSPYI